ncbi:MAG: GNAT family N-acetyltransferase [Nocardioidaceae bacterium]
MMSGGSDDALGRFIRLATLADVEGILDVQEPGAVKGLAHIFPQDEHPFPRDVLRERWGAEIADSGPEVYVSTDHCGRITGFAARRSDELLHFGTAVDLWGTGLAAWLHDELLKTYPVSVSRVRLRVFAENHRARRFYEKCGWTETGVTSRGQFAPYPVLIEYVRPQGL